MAKGVSEQYIVGICVNVGRSRILFSPFLRVFLLLVAFFIGLIPNIAMAISPQVAAANLPTNANITPATIDATRMGQRFEKPIEPSAIQSQILQKEKPKAPVSPEAAAVKFKLSKVVVEGSTVYTTKELERYYFSYLGKSVSLIDLQKIADDITARYRQDGYILSRAVVPAQKIQNGMVIIKVVEGYISEVYIEGDAKGARSKIEADANKIKQMRPLQIKQLERYVLLLNDLPGLSVKSVLSPSTKELGAADLTLITEQKKIAIDISHDNRGTRYLGPQEILATLEFDDALHLADRIVLQTVDTPSTDELRFVQMNYSLPLGSNGLRFDVNGNFAETNPGFILNDLDLVGRSKDWSTGLEYPIIRSRASNLSVHGRFEWLDTNTDFVSENLFEDHIRSLRLGGSYDIVDKARGINTINAELSKGLKVFGASPLDPSTPLSRYHGRSDYTKANADISRLQAIGNRYSLLAAMTGQYSFNQSLLSAEQFAFGGNIYGRGYDSAEIIGDSGVAGKLEFRVDTNPDLRFLRQMQYYVFYDAGAVWNVANNDDNQSSRVTGTTTGGGVRTNLNKYFYGNLEAAKPLTRPADTQVLAGNNGNAWRFYFSLGFKM